MRKSFVENIGKYCVTLAMLWERICHSLSTNSSCPTLVLSRRLSTTSAHILKEMANNLTKTKCKYLHNLLEFPAFWIFVDFSRRNPVNGFQLFFVILMIFEKYKILLVFFLSPALSYLPRTRSPHILAGSRSFQHPGDKTSQCLMKIMEAIIPCQRSNRGRRKFWARDCPTWRKILAQALFACPSSPPEGC